MGSPQHNGNGVRKKFEISSDVFDEVIVSYDNVTEVQSHISGSLILTAHKIVFFNQKNFETIALNYFSICNYSVDSGSTNETKKIKISSKNFRSFEFDLTIDKVEKICEIIYSRTKNLSQIYARKNTKYFTEFEFFDWKREFIRQKIGKEWKLSNANQYYEICASYMNSFIIPSSLTNEEIKEVSMYRSKGRIPVLSFYNHHNGASISRSSQPMVGLFRSRNKFDEKYLEKIRLTVKDPRKQKLFIIDCRSALNAYANSAKGAGTEVIQYYQDCTLEFCGIENIHAMRNSLFEIYNYVSPANTSTWTSQLLSIIQSSKRVAEIVDAGYPVLIHCSDGWDRTSQLSSLSQLLLDPFYRTIKGFQQLIEKDWIRFGHKFFDRCAHGKSNYWEDNEQSPIFLQFLDCVYQLSRQYHNIFEFNSQYLVDILDNVYSCDFGEFLFNNEQNRRDCKQPLASLWHYLDDNFEKYVNKFYERYNGVVLPNCSIKLLQLWDVYLSRHGAKKVTNQEFYFNQRLSEEEVKKNDLQKQLEDLSVKYEKLLQEIQSNKQNIQSAAHLYSPENEKAKLIAEIRSSLFGSNNDKVFRGVQIIDDYNPDNNEPVNNSIIDDSIDNDDDQQNQLNSNSELHQMNSLDLNNSIHIDNEREKKGNIDNNADVDDNLIKNNALLINDHYGDDKEGKTSDSNSKQNICIKSGYLDISNDDYCNNNDNVIIHKDFNTLNYLNIHNGSNNNNNILNNSKSGPEEDHLMNDFQILPNQKEEIEISPESANSWSSYLVNTACKLTNSIFQTKELIQTSQEVAQ